MIAHDAFQVGPLTAFAAVAAVAAFRAGSAYLAGRTKDSEQ